MDNCQSQRSIVIRQRFIKVTQCLIGYAYVRIERSNMKFACLTQRLSHHQSPKKEFKRSMLLTHVGIHKSRLPIQAQKPISFSMTDEDRSGLFGLRQGCGDAVKFGAKIKATNSRTSPPHLIVSHLEHKTCLFINIPGFL